MKFTGIFMQSLMNSKANSVLTGSLHVENMMKNSVPPSQATQATQTTQTTQTIDDKTLAEQEKIKQKAQEFEEVFIADSLKHAKIGMPEGEFGSDSKITDTFSSFMNKALAELIVSQGGFGLSEHITNSLIKSVDKSKPF